MTQIQKEHINRQVRKFSPMSCLATLWACPGRFEGIGEREADLEKLIIIYCRSRFRVC
jgi:hypothetical protein